MKRLLLSLLTLAAIGPACLRGQAADARPNILMILVDDLGYGDLGCQGARDLRTPSIDRLFAQGITFKQFYANSTVCSPSRVSLLTGRYPDQVGVPGVIRQDVKNSWGFLDPTAPTIAEVLARSGYSTAMIGKWHLGLAPPNLPNLRGFQYFKGFLGDMMDDYWTHLRKGVNWMRENRTVISPSGHATDLFAEWACDYLKTQAGAKQPFFLYLAFNAPHDPIQPPEQWLRIVEHREPGIDPKRARLVALIEQLDARIGDVLQVLCATGEDRNTLVVFASDNGGALRFGANNGPLRGGKGDNFEGGIRVPMAARWPGRIQAGVTVQNIALLMDLFPTFCGVAQTDAPKAIDGISLLPLLTGQTENTNDRVLFWVRQEGTLHYGGRTYYAARQGDFKLVQDTPWEPYALYDLKHDPREQSPLAPRGSAYNLLFRALMEHIRLTTVPASP